MDTFTEIQKLLESAPEKDCAHCNGSGKCRNWSAIGEKLRAKRQKARISLREVARRMEISAPYLSDMELGNRNWSTERMAAFVYAISPDYTPSADILADLPQ